MVSTSKFAVGAAVAAAIALASVGCEQETETPPPPPVAEPAAPVTPGAQAPAGDGSGSVTDRVAGLVQEGKDKAEEVAQEGLATVEAKLAELRGRADTVAAENKPAFEKAVADAEAQLQTLRARVEELGEAGRAEWQEISGQVQTELSKLSESVNEALTRFRG